MAVLYILVPLALLLSFGAVVLFWWASRHGQFDDLETPAVRMLLDDPVSSRSALTGDDTGRDRRGS